MGQHSHIDGIHAPTWIMESGFRSNRHYAIDDQPSRLRAGSKQTTEAIRSRRDSFRGRRATRPKERIHSLLGADYGARRGLRRCVSPAPTRADSGASASDEWASNTIARFFSKPKMRVTASYPAASEVISPYVPDSSERRAKQISGAQVYDPDRPHPYVRHSGWP